MGQSLSAMDDRTLAADGEASDAEEEDDGRSGGLSAVMVARANFGGFVRADESGVCFPRRACRATAQRLGTENAGGA